MISRKVIINSLVGLHARPASVFSRTAKKYESKVRVKYKNKEVNGKSAIHLISLNAKYGVEIEIIVDGPDESKALDELCLILEKEE